MEPLEVFVEAPTIVAAALVDACTSPSSAGVVLCSSPASSSSLWEAIGFWLGPLLRRRLFGLVMASAAVSDDVPTTVGVA
mmetsp:Transcript_44869/g.81859  ORF Transcript_44869/g.81859 Transcript_44869/m.81859 type:complete len:80 (-) Transcript_44869:1585-1824(-)